MKDEINQGYVITDRIQVDPNHAFVLGFNPKAPQPFVTWKCGQNDYYYYGHYFNDQDKAIRDLCTRVMEALDDQKELKELAAPVIGGHIARVKSKLPEQCYGILQETGELIRIKRFVSSYFKSDWTTADPEKNQRLADKLNRQAGITKAQRSAMEAGAMLGWDAFGANPDRYNENGQFKKSKHKGFER